MVHFTLSQDLLPKCWETSHCPRTSCSSVGTFHTVPRPLVQVLGNLGLTQDLLVKCWDTSHCPKNSCSSVGILHTVPRPTAYTLGHCTLSQDLLLKCREISHCPKTPAQLLGQTDLLFFGTVGSLGLWRWDCRIFCSLALGYLNHYPQYHHLSSSIKKSSQKPNPTNQKFYLLASLKLRPLINPMQAEI